MFSGGIERHQWHEMCCLFGDADTTVFEDIITYVSLTSRPMLPSYRNQQNSSGNQ